MPTNLTAKWHLRSNAVLQGSDRPGEDDVFDEAKHLVVNACSTECWVIIFRSVNPCVPQEQRVWEAKSSICSKKWQEDDERRAVSSHESCDSPSTQTQDGFTLSLCLKVKEQCPSIREKTVHFTSICEIVMLVDRYEMHQVVEWVTEWMGLLKWAAVGCDVN